MQPKLYTVHVSFCTTANVIDEEARRVGFREATLQITDFR